MQLTEVLRGGRQCDEDGTEIIMSRQACHEAANEIERLQSLSNETLDLLAMMFDAYEEGPDCYEDPEDCAGHLGKAVNLDEAAFDRIADILNKHRPRVTPNV